jgi:hypothetical protein
MVDDGCLCRFCCSISRYGRQHDLQPAASAHSAFPDYLPNTSKSTVIAKHTHVALVKAAWELKNTCNLTAHDPKYCEFFRLYSHLNMVGSYGVALTRLFFESLRWEREQTEK